MRLDQSGLESCCVDHSSSHVRFISFEMAPGATENVHSSLESSRTRYLHPNALQGQVLYGFSASSQNQAGHQRRQSRTPKQNRLVSVLPSVRNGSSDLQQAQQKISSPSTRSVLKSSGSTPKVIQHSSDPINYRKKQPNLYQKQK